MRYFTSVSRALAVVAISSSLLSGCGSNSRSISRPVMADILGDWMGAPDIAEPQAVTADMDLGRTVSLSVSYGGVYSLLVHMKNDGAKPAAVSKGKISIKGMTFTGKADVQPDNASSLGRFGEWSATLSSPSHDAILTVVDSNGKALDFKRF